MSLSRVERCSNYRLLLLPPCPVTFRCINTVICLGNKAGTNVRKARSMCKRTANLETTQARRVNEINRKRETKERKQQIRQEERANVGIFLFYGSKATDGEIFCIIDIVCMSETLLSVPCCIIAWFLVVSYEDQCRVVSCSFAVRLLLRLFLFRVFVWRSLPRCVTCISALFVLYRCNFVIHTKEKRSEFSIRH